MFYSIEKAPNDDYIEMVIVGNTTRLKSIKSNIDAHKMARKLNINKFLVDMTNCRNIDSISENYKFAYEDMLNTPEIDRSVTVAVVISEGDHSHDFIETVALNAGLTTPIYTSRKEALDFLLNS